MLRQLFHKIAALLGIGMIVSGAILTYYTVAHFPPRPVWRPTSAQSFGGSPQQPSPVESQPSPLSARSPESAIHAPARLLLHEALPTELSSALLRISDDVAEIDIVMPSQENVSDAQSNREAQHLFDIVLDFNLEGGVPIFDQYFAATKRMTTLPMELTRDQITDLWQASPSSDENLDRPAPSSLVVLSSTIPAVQQILGARGGLVRGLDSVDEIVAATVDESSVIAIVPFDVLSPALSVIPVDGMNPAENANLFAPADYPLVATVFAHPANPTLTQAWSKPDAIKQFFAALADQIPTSNRDPSQLTIIVMTGVTAMVRLTAEQMDRLGSDWPAAEIGTDLASADITVISNEVPFVSDCETNTDLDNLVFCSKPEYMETLLATGVDIVGLTGNHQNDYGAENSLLSLAFYKEQNLHTYGGGATLHDATAPLVIEHNGNRLAFLGANSYGPPSAWATDSRPGSAPFDLNIMSAEIRSLKADRAVDVVLAELQYQESYHTEPLFEQRQDFKALVRAGADIVTGVQSHVPQGIELFQDSLILYGLGNLFFDQMWSESTRQGLIARHTIYAGRHISTQLLPTMLYDYGQPRWANDEERTTILEQVFAASYGP